MNSFKIWKGEHQDESTVTLMGEVTRPSLKSDAEAVIKQIEGVESIDNQIEVLPLSPNDDRIRLAEYRAIYRQARLSRYALQAVPPIHIIVKNGNVRLEGVVATEADKNLAGMRAKGVSGVFSVNNNPSRRETAILTLAGLAGQVAPDCQRV
jgi:hyperosmotically inducible protein